MVRRNLFFHVSYFLKRIGILFMKYIHGSIFNRQMFDIPCTFTFQHSYFNQALAEKEEIQASNGVIYLVDEVLNTPEGTVWQILNNKDYNLTTFANVVLHARENTKLNSTGRCTFLHVFFV